MILPEKNFVKAEPGAVYVHNTKPSYQHYWNRRIHEDLTFKDKVYWIESGDYGGIYTQKQSQKKRFYLDNDPYHPLVRFRVKKGAIFLKLKKQTDYEQLFLAYKKFKEINPQLNERDSPFALQWVKSKSESMKRAGYSDELIEILTDFRFLQAHRIVGIRNINQPRVGRIRSSLEWILLNPFEIESAYFSSTALPSGSSR